MPEGQAIDTTTPAGRLLFHVLARSGRAIGRPRRHHVDREAAQALLAAGYSIRRVARELGVSPQAVSRVTKVSVAGHSLATGQG